MRWTMIKKWGCPAVADKFKAFLSRRQQIIAQIPWFIVKLVENYNLVLFSWMSDLPRVRSCRSIFYTVLGSARGFELCSTS